MWCKECDEKRIAAGGFTNIPRKEKIKVFGVCCERCAQKLLEDSERQEITVELFGEKYEA
jgi:protein-arginine kinase activator protein McsA